jgi:hypothetical protein
MVLVRVVIEQLRSQQVIIPPLSVIERLCAEANYARRTTIVPQGAQRIERGAADGARRRTERPFGYETINAGMAATSAWGG